MVSYEHNDLVLSMPSRQLAYLIIAPTTINKYDI